MAGVFDFPEPVESTLKAALSGGKIKSKGFWFCLRGKIFIIKIKGSPVKMHRASFFVAAPTYFPGRLPSKYFRHEWA